MSAFLNALREEGTFEEIAAFIADPAYAKHKADLIDLTMKFDEHPEGYDGPCLCKLCQSYA